MLPCNKITFLSFLVTTLCLSIFTCNHTRSRKHSHNKKQKSSRRAKRNHKSKQKKVQTHQPEKRCSVKRVRPFPEPSLLWDFVNNTDPTGIPVTLRMRNREDKKSYDFTTSYEQVTIPPEKAALLICDMWDKHPCPILAGRAEILAEKMGPIINTIRDRGIQIIHAPSGCMEFYETWPQRTIIQHVTQRHSLPNYTRPLRMPRRLSPPKIFRHQCKYDHGNEQFICQHPAITIAENDIILDCGKELYNYLRSHYIQYLFYAGVHTNVCIMSRSFGIKSMYHSEIQCILIRDLTQASYNNNADITCEEATELVAEWIETYYCPSVLSADFVGE